MFRKDIKLVICDIDGSLVTSDHRLTERAKSTIDRLHDRGIYFGIASGRSIEQHLSKQAKNWGFDYDFEILIGLNGAELWDDINQKHNEYYKLKSEWLKEIIEMMEPFELNPFIYRDQMSLYYKVDPSVIASAKRNKTKYKIVEDVAELYEKETAKILFRMSEEMMEKVEPYVMAHPSPYYRAFKTQTTVLEFADIRVNKAVPLKVFCDRNGINLAQVVAFGDMSNDNELLETSGLGVCLLNGDKQTKAIADVVTDKTNDEDGFAHFMEKYFLD